MPTIDIALFKSAAQEVLRPLQDFVEVIVDAKSISLNIKKTGLHLCGDELAELKLAPNVKSLRTLAAWVRCVLHDNLSNSVLHAKPQWISASQYTTKDFEKDKAALANLYRDNFVSAEKKDLVADLENSQGHYIMSSLNPHLHIFDAASQIASFNLGFNSTKRHALFMRPEAQSQTPIENSDLEIALGNLLKRKSGLAYAHILNSGSEANDFCLSHFKMHYPQRSQVFAFEGSFHGRTLLALHTTHSPAKREPFEIYKGLVEFFSFPETKNPTLRTDEPKEWLSYWSSTTEDHTNPIFLGWLKQRDSVFVTEACVLEKLRKEFRAGHLPFALIIEPMQCEGGDRYATARFMRALRVLTRAYDVPLIFDEVQTGFGLGGPFFWHTTFKLQSPDGNPEYPDAITVAKKAQVAGCICNYKWESPGTASLAGLHRGYIQAQAAIEGPEVDDLAPLALKCLEAFKDDTIPEWVNHARGQAFALAFDLPTPQIATDLIKARFDNGILIYPAGEQTLRFRLMVTTRRRDLYEMFVALYGCFETVAKAHNLKLKAELESFKTTLQTILSLEEMDFAHKYTEAVSKDQAILPRKVEDLKNLDAGKWQKVFKTLMRLHPELVNESTLDLAALKTTTTEALIARYQSSKDFSFSWLNLLWELSRKHSFNITIWNDRDIENHRAHIDELQAATYEPARRSSVDSLVEQTRDARTLALACTEDDDTLSGMCIAVPLDTAYDLPFFLNDNEKGIDKRDLYSTDLTVDSKHRSNGLGLRMKVEQLIAARLRNCRRITSRNRYPEAKAMSKLNQKLGAVVCHISHTDYGGSGTGYYQSLELHSPAHPLKIFQNHSTLLNKMCLSNFVSQAYLNFLEIWRHALPPAYRHVYLSSGESEALDKWIKTLFWNRPKAHYALSFFGDKFGTGTAAAMSLGRSPNDKSPFEWPCFDTDGDAVLKIDQYLQKHPSDEILGFFVEPNGKPWLKDLISLCQIYKIPVIFNETRSMMGAYQKDLLFASSAKDLKPDGFFAYGGNQIAINAVSDALFIAKPLTMISTWDGDEWSLQIFTESLLRYLSAQ